MTRHLYLVGYRGTGKSTVGRLVARTLGWPFVDLDERIEAEAGTSIAGIFAAEGEAGFRDREAAALAEASAQMGGAACLSRKRERRAPTGMVASESSEDTDADTGASLTLPALKEETADPEWAVIATGGGIILREENRRILKATGFVVWLQACAEAIWERVRADTLTAARRPNLTVAGGLPEIVELLAVRERYYTEVADVRVPTDGRSPEAVAASILTLFRSIPTD